MITGNEPYVPLLEAYGNTSNSEYRTSGGLSIRQELSVRFMAKMLDDIPSYEDGIQDCQFRDECKIIARRASIAVEVLIDEWDRLEFIQNSPSNT